MFTCDGTTVEMNVLSLHNANTTTENVLLYYVPNGDSADNTTLFANIAVAANDTVNIDFSKCGIIFEDSGDTLQAVTDTASKVVLTAFGFSGTTLARLTSIAYVADSVAAVYTAGTADAYVKTIILHNTNTTTENVLLYYVPNGDSAGAANLLYNIAIVANDTIFLDYPTAGLVLSTAGDAIEAVTDTASKVTIQIYGDTA